MGGAGRRGGGVKGGALMEINQHILQRQLFHCSEGALGCEFLVSYGLLVCLHHEQGACLMERLTADIRCRTSSVGKQPTGASH